MAELTECLDFLIEDGTALYDSLDMYYPDLQASLDDTEAVSYTHLQGIGASCGNVSLLFSKTSHYKSPLNVSIWIKKHKVFHLKRLK